MAHKTHKVARCELFIQMINPKRFRDLRDCLLIGSAIHSAYEGTDFGLDKWCKCIYSATFQNDDISKQMDTFNALKDTLRGTYNVLSSGKITIATLAYYAKQDSPEDFDNFKNQLLSEVRKQAHWYEFKKGKMIEIHE